MKKFYKAVCFLATLAFAAAPSISTASDSDIPLIAIGQVESVDLESGAISVNGQTIVFDLHTELLGSENEQSVGYLALGDIQPSDYVAVEGELMDPGVSLATAVALLPESYTDGASPTYSRVILSGTDNGYALSAATTINATSSTASFAPGDIAEFYGVVIGGEFIASGAAVTTAEAASVLAIRGSGVRAIRGSGVRAIRGSGVRAIRGSGVRAIRGSGVRAIRGSGVR